MKLYTFNFSTRGGKRQVHLDEFKARLIYLSIHSSILSKKKKRKIRDWGIPFSIVLTKQK